MSTQDDDLSPTGPATTGLAQLQAQYDDILAGAKTIDLPIKGYENARRPVALRVKALHHDVIRRQATRILKAKPGTKAAVEMESAATLIQLATEAVLIGAEDDGQEEYDLLDPALAAAVREPGAKQVLPVIRALCLGKDGQVLKLSERIQIHSGYEQAEADQEFLGE